MPSTSSSPGGARRAQPNPDDAVGLLQAERLALALLFAEFKRTRSASNKQALVAEICDLLEVHLQVEEELFYPAVRPLLRDAALIAGAGVDHAGIKDLVWQLRDLTPAAERYDARVEALAGQVEQHGAEEERTMFPQVRAGTLDLGALGARMKLRRAVITAAVLRAPAVHVPLA